MKTTALSLLLLPFLANVASAQVVITEVQPNPNGPDLAEWIEIQNIGNVAVDVGGWTFYEFTAGTPSTMWVFPAGLMLMPTQVVVVTKQAATFNQRASIEWNGFRPDFEMAFTIDDPMIPNVTGGPNFNLEDGDDAFILEDDLGAYIDGVEWGSDRTEVPGSPVMFWPMPQFSEGVSMRRVAVGGDSATDFMVALVTDPGTGYVAGMGSPPMIFGPMRAPPVYTFGATGSMSAMAIDTDGVMSVDYYLTFASDVTGGADADYVALNSTRVMNTYSVEGTIGSFPTGLEFTEPTNFHERYVRWFIEGTDGLGASGRLPMAAIVDATNTEYYWENVLPSTGVATLAEVRAQSADEQPTWMGHSVRIEGVVLTDQTAFSDIELNFFISSPTSVDAVRVFDDVLNPVDVAPGDLIRLEGKVGSQRGVRQIGQDERTMQVAEHRGNEIIITKIGTAPVPIQTVTIGALLADAERFESQLVELRDVMMVPGPNNDPIPTTFAAETTVYVSDGTELPVRIFGNTTVVGEMVPTEMFAIRGIFTQTAEMGPYQIQPRFAEDIAVDVSNVDAGVVDAGGQADAGGGAEDGGAGVGDGGGNVGDDDAGVVDAGMGGGGGDKDPDGGCGCSAAERPTSGLWGLIFTALLFIRPRRRS